MTDDSNIFIFIKILIVFFQPGIYKVNLTYVLCKFQAEKMHAHGHEQGRNSKREATSKHGHFTT